MEAMEGFEDLGNIGNQSVRAIAKLADSDKVWVPVSSNISVYALLYCMPVE